MKTTTKGFKKYTLKKLNDRAHKSLRFNDVVLTEEGIVYAVGRLGIPKINGEPNVYKAYIVKLDINLIVLAEYIDKVNTKEDDSEFECCCLDNHNNIIVTGYRESNWLNAEKTKVEHNNSWITLNRFTPDLTVHDEEEGDYYAREVRVLASGNIVCSTTFSSDLKPT